MFAMIDVSTVRGIISAAGGRQAIADASANPRFRAKKTISVEAVHKWPKIGIAEDHWPLMLQLVAGLTVQDIYAANRRLEKEAAEADRTRKRKRVA
jgi:hypothetical protein